MNLYLGGLHMNQNFGCDVVQDKYHTFLSNFI